jgi:hypothetical protein
LAVGHIVLIAFWLFFEWLLKGRFAAAYRDLKESRFSLNQLPMSPFFKRVLLTGLIAGILDITYAYLDVLVQTGRISGRMFQFIAGGALGLETSMKGGVPVILLGIFFHFFIAFLFTLFFFVLYRNSKSKSKLSTVNPYLLALLYGIFIWCVMTLVVLPLSALPSRPIKLAKGTFDALMFGVTFGLVLVFSARNYFGTTEMAAA